jgi:hypothetical protein
MFEHNFDCSRRLVGVAVQPDGDAAEGGHRQADRHAHAANGAVHHDAPGMKIDKAHAAVGRVVDSFKPRGQREGVEPQRAARPGS